VHLTPHCNGVAVFVVWPHMVALGKRPRSSVPSAEQSKPLRNESDQVTKYALRASVLEAHGELDSAIDNFQRAAAYSGGDLVSFLRMRRQVAICLRKKSQFDRALDMHRECIAKANLLKNPLVLSGEYCELATTLRALAENDSSEETMLKALRTYDTAVEALEGFEKNPKHDQMLSVLLKNSADVLAFFRRKHPCIPQVILVILERAKQLLGPRGDDDFDLYFLNELSRLVTLGDAQEIHLCKSAAQDLVVFCVKYSMFVEAAECLWTLASILIEYEHAEDASEFLRKALGYLEKTNQDVTSQELTFKCQESLVWIDRLISLKDMLSKEIYDLNSSFNGVSIDDIEGAPNRMRLEFALKFQKHVSRNRACALVSSIQETLEDKYDAIGAWSLSHCFGTVSENEKSRLLLFSNMTRLSSEDALRILSRCPLILSKAFRDSSASSQTSSDCVGLPETVETRMEQGIMFHVCIGSVTFVLHLPSHCFSQQVKILKDEIKQVYAQRFVWLIPWSSSNKGIASRTG